MKRKLIAVFLAMAVAAVQVTPVFAETNDASGNDSAENEVVVVFEEDASNAAMKRAAKAVEGEITDKVDMGSETAAIISLDGESVDEAVNELNENSKVKIAQKNIRYEFTEDDESEDKGKYYQYQMDLLNVAGAWDLLENKGYRKDGEKTKVAVIDSGVDTYHEDLQEVLSKDIIDNGYVTMKNGSRIEGNKTDAGSITIGHGTHVSGIIGATYGNDKGGYGIASGTNNDLCELLVIGSSEDGESLFTFDIVKAIQEAKTQGAKVVNMSFGGSYYDSVIERTINECTEAGMVFVASAGNAGDEDNEYPSDYANVISVISVDESGSKSIFSNYGLEKDIAAAGNSVLSTVPGDRYDNYSGTSMATPCITAICALMLDANPDMTPAQVKNVLTASTKSSKFSEKRGYGIADAEAAVKAAYELSDENAAEKFEIKKSETVRNIYTGKSTDIETIVRPANHKINPSLMKWTSSDDTIATVKDGKVTGVSEGKAIITAEYMGIKSTCFINVSQSIPAEKIEVVNKEELQNMEVGTLSDIHISIEPLNNTETLYFESDNKDVASVEAGSGTVMATGAGKATITVMTSAAKYDGIMIDGVTYVTIDINVGKTAAKVAFTKDTSKLLVGEKFTFSAEARNTKNETDTAYRIINYYSTDTSVLKVDEKTGEVTATGEGTAFVRAAIKYTPIIAVKKVTVGKNKLEKKDYGLKLSSYTAKSATLKWNSINVADSYKIYRKAAGENDFAMIAEVKGTSKTYKDKTVTPGIKYEYKITACYVNSDIPNSVEFDASSTVSVKPVPAKAVAKVKGNTVSWSKISDVSGYEIYYATLKNGKYKKVSSITKTTYKAKTGWYKVRAYAKTKSGNVYGSFSEKVRVK